MRQIFNPILPLDEYVPDGEPHVFGDRVYLFGSHDQEGGNAYCLLDYICYSAPVKDLTDWRCEGIIYRAAQDPAYSEKRRYMYAPDVVRGNDGRYYLYYCLVGDYDISVAVCDTPAGKYEYYGNVRNRDGSLLRRFLPADPAVINDNGIIRLYYGWSLALTEEHLAAMKAQPVSVEEQLISIQTMLFPRSREEILAEPDGIMGANTVALEDDMLTVREEPKRIVPGQFAAQGTGFEGHAFYEASSIRKIKDTYYFIYSPQSNNQLCYATSRYPDKDFAYRGVIISNCDVEYMGRKQQDALNLSGTNHGSIEKINGQWYVFYHRLTHGSDYSRQACAEKITILPDGTIPQEEVTTQGLNGKPLAAEGVYPAAIACNITNGHMPNIQFEQVKMNHSLPRVTHEGEQHYITGIVNGTMIGYKYFHFNSETRMVLVLRGKAEGTMSVSGNDRPFGDIHIHTMNEWTESEIMIPQVGDSALFLTYQGRGELELLEIRYMKQS